MPEFETPKINDAEKTIENVEKDKEEQRRKKIIDLTRELSESRECFIFPGFDSDSYQRLKAQDEEFPGLVTPIDELEKRFKEEGIKIVFGSDPESCNVYILPFGSNDNRNDGIFPEHLKIVENMDPRFKELILTRKS